MLELFYKMYSETSTMSEEKIQFEKKLNLLEREKSDLKKAQEKLESELSKSRSELNDHHALNEALLAENDERVVRIQ